MNYLYDKEMTFRLIYGMIMNAKNLYDFENKQFTFNDWYFNRKKPVDLLEQLKIEGYIIEKKHHLYPKQKIFKVTKKYCDEISTLLGKNMVLPVDKSLIKTTRKEEKDIIRNSGIDNSPTSVVGLEKELQKLRKEIFKISTNPKYEDIKIQRLKELTVLVNNIEKRLRVINGEKILKKIKKKL